MQQGRKKIEFSDRGGSVGLKIPAYILIVFHGHIGKVPVQVPPVEFFRKGLVVYPLGKVSVVVQNIRRPRRGSAGQGSFLHIGEYNFNIDGYG